MATFTWTGKTGLWGTPANWSPSGTPSGATDVAIINAAGSYAATVETGVSYAILHTSLDSAEATLDVLGTLALVGTLAVSNGTLNLSAGGVIEGGTITTVGGVFTANGGTLSGVTVLGDLPIGHGATLTVIDGLTALPLGGAARATIEVFGDDATLVFGDTQTLDSLAINLGGDFSAISVPSGTLTLGLGVVTTGNAPLAFINGNIVNLGTLEQASGLTILGDGSGPSTFDNKGLLHIIGGNVIAALDQMINSGEVRVGSDGVLNLALQSGFDNTGSLAIEAGGTLALLGSMTLTDLTSISGVTNEGVLELLGTLDLQAGTLTVAPDTLFNIVQVSDDGTITSGTILPAGGTLTAQGGTLANVTVLGPFEVGDDSFLTTTGTFAVQDAGGGPGTITFGSASALKILGALAIGQAGALGTITMANDRASLLFDNGGTLDDVFLDAAGDLSGITATDAPLLLGPDLIAVMNSPEFQFQGSFINQATITIAAGTTYVEGIAGIGTFDNQGSIGVGPASLNLRDGTFVNTGAIEVAGGGTLTIGPQTSLINTGAITLDAGATLARLDNTTLSDLTGGGIVNNGGTLVVSGLLDLQGGTMDIAPTGLFSTVDVTEHGTIVNGTIVQNGGFFSPSGGILDEVVLRGGLDIPLFETIHAINGLTVSDTTGTAPGTVTVGFGGTLAVGGGLTLGAAARPGVIDMTSDLSALRVLDSFTLDDTTVMIRGDSNQLSVESAILTLGTSVIVDLAASTFYGFGGLVNQGTILQFTGLSILSDWDFGDTLDNQGMLSLRQSDFWLDLSNFTNTGTVLVGDGADLVISPFTTFTSNGSFVIQGGGAVDLLSPTASTVTFQGSGLLFLDIPSDFTGLLRDFGSGGALELGGEIINSASITGTTLTVNLDGGGMLTYQVDPGLDGLAPTIAEGRDGALNRLVMPCFAAGTLIRTVHGCVRVEDLRVGDHVVIATGGSRPIAWIGYRRIDCRRHPRPAAVYPVQIKAHAFARNRPARDLCLSPDHAVFAENVLIPVRHLLNGNGVRQVACDEVTYYHIELDHHDIVLAEGLPVESYLDTGDRSVFQDANGPIRLHPEFNGPPTDALWMWEALGRARLVVTGHEVDQVRAALRQRAQYLKSSSRRTVHGRQAPRSGLS